MSITRKTNLYDHKNPPRAEKEPETGMLCPMSRKECLTERCMLWDDECRACGLDAINLYNKIREAVTDAAVDVVNAYGGDGLHG